MPALTETFNLGDLLKYEAPNLYSRDTVTVAAGQNLLLGTVLSRDASTGKFQALNPAATDGTECAVGVLAVDVDATLAEREDALLIARHAILAQHALVWPKAITPSEKATAIAQLTACGVLIRNAA